MSEIVTNTVAGCRAAEAEAFRKAAGLLSQAAASGKKDVMEQALRFNQLLWSLIVADITEKDNTLPIEIKANIMSLTIFVENQTEKAAASAEAKDLEPLININQNLAEGLQVKAA